MNTDYNPKIYTWDQFTLKRDYLTERQCFSRIGFSYLALYGISMLIQFILMYIISAAFPALLYNTSFITGSSMTTMYLIGVPTAALLMRRIPFCPPQCHPLSPLLFFRCLLVGISFMYIGSILGDFTMAGLDAILGTNNLNEINALAEASTPLLWTVLTVFAAPIFEEYLFRKLLLDRTKQFGEAFAIILSGLLFGLFHGNLYQFFYAASIGMILAYLYLRTGRLRWSILLHMTINLIGGIINPLISKFSANYVIAIYTLILLACVISGITILFRKHKHIHLHKPQCVLQRGYFFTVVCNPGMLLFLLVVLGEFVFDVLS